MSVDGLQCDIERLLQTFIETGEIRFSTFTTCWKNLNFSRIISGRVTHNDYRVFLEEAFRLCLLYISPKFSEHVRIGSLYTMYSFYFLFNFTKPGEGAQGRKKLTMHQHHRNQLPIQIRVTLEIWNEIQTLVHWIRQNDHIDAEYIFKKLELSHAFSICLQIVPANRTERWSSTKVHKDIRCGLPIVKFNRDRASRLTQQSASFLPKFTESTNTKKLHLVAEKYKQVLSSVASDSLDNKSLESPLQKRNFAKDFQDATS